MTAVDYQKTIKALEARIRVLESQLVTDELTQILNRRGLMDYLEVLAGEVRWQGAHPDKRRKVTVTSLSIVFIDIDNFKSINTDYGHDGGDTVLQELAHIIKDQVRALDIVGRYGGEEIVLGLVGATLRDAERVAEHVRARIESTSISMKNKQKITVTASLGVAEMGQTMSLAETIKKADTALYEAKSSGRNRVVIAE
ncbi:MAG: GGDEF domain-containing protein [bacterium]